MHAFHIRIKYRVLNVLYNFKIIITKKKTNPNKMRKFIRRGGGEREISSKIKNYRK